MTLLQSFLKRHTPTEPYKREKKERTEEERWEAVELCGSFGMYTNHDGKKRSFPFYCKDRLRCPECRKRYISSAIEDLCVAYEDFGGLWIYNGNVHPEERDTIYQRLYRSELNKQYLRIDVSEEQSIWIVAHNRRPEVSKMTDWAEFDPYGIDDQAKYAIAHESGTKSGGLVNYQEKKKETDDEQPTCTLPKPIIIVNKTPDYPLNINWIYANAVMETVGLKRTANISPSFRADAIKVRTDTFVELLKENDYEVTVIWQKSRVKLSTLKEELFE